MRKVLHGDRVVVRKSARTSAGRAEAKIVEVIERVNPASSGGSTASTGSSSFSPPSGVSARTFTSRRKMPGAHARGRWWSPSSPCSPTVARAGRRIVEVLGDAADPGIEIEIALRKHDLLQILRGRRTARCEISWRLRARAILPAARICASSSSSHRRRDRRDFDDAV